MKILHTADWHLGKKLDRFSRLEEQKDVLAEIIQIANEQQVDLVLIAGDLFDSFHPSTEAITLFYQTLKKLSQNGKRPVVAISGNHDSPSFIDAPNALAQECGIILIGEPNAVVPTIKLEDFEITQQDEGFFELKLNHLNYPVRIFHTAFANEIRLKAYFGENKEEELNKILAENWLKSTQHFADEKGVNILTTHLYMNKRGSKLLEEPEGEKPLKIGNADLVFSDIIPAEIQYTALGHLHSFQNIGSIEKPVIYCSSLLEYSFSEAVQTKYINLIEAEPNQKVKFEKIPLKSGKKLVRKTFDDIEKAVNWLTQNPETWVELTLEMDTFLKAEDRKSLLQSHQGIVYLIPRIKHNSQSLETAPTLNLNQETATLFKEYFKSKNNGQEPNQQIMDLFQEIKNTNL